VTLIVYFVVGRLLIWVLQTAGPVKLIYQKSSFLTELFECDFCLGCWVFALLGFLFKISLFAELLDIVPYILGVVITAIIASFCLQLFVIGWRSQYGATYLE